MVDGHCLELVKYKLIRKIDINVCACVQFDCNFCNSAPPQVIFAARLAECEAYANEARNMGIIEMNFYWFLMNFFIDFF